jgi:hypothetical protein
MAKTPSNSITIDLKALTVTVNPDNEVVLTDKADKELVKLLELEAQVAEVKQAVMDKLKGAMAKHPAKPAVVIGLHVKVRRSETGSRFDFASKKDAPEDFTKVSTTVRKFVDADKVDEYFKLNDTLPEGIVAKERPEKVTIELVA